MYIIVRLASACVGFHVVASLALQLFWLDRQVRGSFTMFGQRVASLALVLGAAHPLGGGWSLLRLFPDLQLGNGHAGHCREDDTSPHGNVSRSDDSNSTNGSESDWEDSWDRGENTRPDPEHSAAWLVWFLRVSWGSIWKLAENGIMWCGTLCASVSIAAKWSYWLLVAVVLVFCLQLLLWTISWVILPCMRHLIALYRYLMGRGAWHEVVNLHGVSTFRPRWYGPKGQHEWTAEYIQQQVRGRGESREPHDLLVTDGVAIARIRHGTLRGRNKPSRVSPTGGGYPFSVPSLLSEHPRGCWVGSTPLCLRSLRQPRRRCPSCAGERHHSTCHGARPAGDSW